MPGFLYHLACAKKVCELDRNLIPEWLWNDFALANLVPDLAVSKEVSHFQIKNVDGWLVPDLGKAKERLKSFGNVLILGAFCHLALDSVFFEEVLSAKYRLDGEKVFAKFDEREWTLPEFLSRKGLYGAYSLWNLELVRHHMVPDIWVLPAEVPMTGAPELDSRNERNWRKEVQGYFADPVLELENPVVSYEEMENSVNRGAEEFLRLINE